MQKPKLPKQVSLKTTVGICLISVLLASLALYYVWAATPTATFWISPGVYPGAPSYTVWKEGSDYFAKDANGELDFTGINATKVIDDAIDALSTSHGDILLVGNISIETGISLDQSYVSLRGSLEWATNIVYTGTGSAIRVGLKGGVAKELNKVENMRIVGSSSGAYGLEVYSLRTSLANLFIEDFTNGKGIWFSGNNTSYSWSAYASVYNVEISNCKYGITIGSPGTLPYNMVRIFGSALVGASGANQTGLAITYGSAYVSVLYVAGWEEALLVETNNNELYEVEFEANEIDLHITTGQYTKLSSSTFDTAKYVDAGFFTEIFAPTYIKLAPITHPTTTGWTSGQAYLGRMWFCTTHFKIEYWNGTTIITP